jgi:hypothetical protein
VSIRNAIERDAARVAAQELERRRTRLASLRPAERELVTDVAHRLAQAVSDLLLAQAQTEPRLGAALSAIYFISP